LIKDINNRLNGFYYRFIMAIEVKRYIFIYLYHCLRLEK
jgi:hypothetical protein